MSRHARIDIGEIQAAVKTQNGFLRAPCYATRAGVFSYLNPDGTTRKELRPHDEVFHPDSLSSLVSVPVTDEHPADLVTPENATVYSRGVTSETVGRELDFVKTAITVFDKRLIQILENRMKSEVSCGYTCDVDETAGEYEGEAYDCIQRNIRYNHLAVVEKGRGGPLVRVRIDGAECAHQVTETIQEKMLMAKVKLDSVEFEASETLALAVSNRIRRDDDQIAALQAQLTALQAELDKMKGQYDAKEVEMDALKSEQEKQADSSSEDEEKKDENSEEEKVDNKPGEKMDSAKIHALVQKRLALLRKAEPFVTSTAKFDSMTDRQIKVEVIKTKMTDFRADSVSNAYIDGLFEGFTASTSRVDSLARSVNDSRNSTTVTSAAEARKRAMEADRNAWKRA